MFNLMIKIMKNILKTTLLASFVGVSSMLFAQGNLYTDTLRICPNVSKEVDALIQIQNGNSSIQDANFSTNGQLLIDAWTQGGQLKISRTLMKWDFSSIPAGSTIQSATLKLSHNSTSTTGNSTEAGSNEAWVERITQGDGSMANVKITDAYGVVKKNINTMNSVENINISNLQFGIYNVAVTKGSDMDTKHLQVTP